MTATLCKLYAADGRAAAAPEPIQAEVSWRAADGLAQAFRSDGKLVAELQNARIEWVEAGGIRFSGMEATDETNTEFRVQAWQYRPGG